MNNETERTLHELKRPGMASCWSSLEETHQLDKLTLREGMQIMLQHEREQPNTASYKECRIPSESLYGRARNRHCKGNKGLLCSRPCNRKLYYGRNDGHHYRTGRNRKIILRMCSGGQGMQKRTEGIILHNEYAH